MISPVCIWEILATSDSFEKEKLIYMSQNLFDSELLPGPGELILKYIFQGCPKVEKRRDLVSESDLAGTWKNLVDCTEKTFVYKKDELDAIMSALKDLNRIIFGLAKNQPEYFSETIESSTLRFLDAEINKISHCCPTNPNQKMA